MDFDNHEFMKKQFDSFVKTSRNYTNHIIEAVVILEKYRSLQGSEIVSGLAYNSCRLLSALMNMSYFNTDELLSQPDYIIDISEFLPVILAECSRILEPIERDVQLIINCDYATVRIDEKVFTLAIMNLLQNALLYSPEKSAVIVELGESDNYDEMLCISITSLTDIPIEKENSGNGIPLCMKISQSHNGKLEYTEFGGKTTARLELPITDTDSVFPVTFDFIDYVGERLKPVNLFMNEVIYESKSKE